MRLFSANATNSSCCFNPRICKRCDFFISTIHNYTAGFNPRICKRCDFVHSICPCGCGVSIHASVKDATLLEELDLAEKKSFNPRICKRCDYSVFSCKYGVQVSIHASVKDATISMWDILDNFTVSIHASVKDATTR